MLEPAKVDGREIVVLAEDLHEDLELRYPILRPREEGVAIERPVAVSA